MENNKIPPEIQLFTEERLKTERNENLGLFSGKWVEKGATWLLYAVGAIILAGIIKAAAPYLVSAPAVTTGPTITSASSTTK